MKVAIGEVVESRSVIHKLGVKTPDGIFCAEIKKEISS